MRSVIHTSLAPTITSRDVRLSLALFTGTARTENARKNLEEALGDHLDGRRVCCFDSGRNALRSTLEVFGIGPGDEVLVQAYTCVSVPGPVRWVGARPVFVDIRPETFAMDPDDLARKISPRSKALVIQHTFGLPADIGPLIEIAHRHRLIVIEDCAHALGASYQGRPVGTFAHAAIFSFGRDKVISSVFGGAVALQDEGAVNRLQIRMSHLQSPSSRWVAQQLLHPIAMGFVRPTYWYGGRHLLRGLQLAKVLSMALTPREKLGGEPPLLSALLPDALAQLALEQFARLQEFLHHRRMIAKHYAESLQDIPGISLPTIPGDRTHGFLRYPIRVRNPAALHAAARREGIILGDWYDTVVAPRDCDLAAVGYAPGSCKNAEDAARHSVNLPTSPILTLPDADRVLQVVRAYAGNTSEPS